MRDSNQSLRAILLLAGFIVVGCSGPPPTPSPTPVTFVAPTPSPDPHLRDPASAEVVYRALQAAGLDITANTASSGPGGEPVRRIIATYEGWPLLLSEYSSAKALAKATPWKAGVKPGQGEPPISIKGLNILIEWGPTTGSRPPRPDARQLAAIAAVVAAIDPLLFPLRTRTVVALTLPVHTPAPSPSPGGSASRSPAASAATP